MKRTLSALVAVLLLSLSGIAQTTYIKVSSASQLEAGAQYLLIGYDHEGNAFVMSHQKTNNRNAVTINETGGVVTATVATAPSQQDVPYEFTLGGTPGAWTIYDSINNGYLCAPGGGNYLRTQSTLDDKGRWTITDGNEGGMVPVSNGGEEQCFMRYNITSTLFGCYKESSTVSAPVYFFKAGNAVQPDPEPSNYPTNFVAEVDGACITLTWTDAIGDQLPHKYLILGSTGDITLPQDGIPVANSELAVNVNYGVQRATLCNLQGNTTYHFAIFPYTNSDGDINYKTDSGWPMVEATTENVHNLLYENFDEDLGVFTAYDVYGDQSWHQAIYQETTYANMNGYSGGAHQNEDWLIAYVQTSPDMVFNEIWLEFSTAMKFDGDPLRVAVSSNYDGNGNPNNFDWNDITSAFAYSTGNYEWVESGKIDIASSIPEYPNPFYLAFIYTSTDEQASTWEIDYVRVSGTHVNAVDETTAPVVSLYPNPVSSEVSFGLDNDAQVSIFDMMGRKLNDVNAEAGQVRLDVSELDSGVYFVNIRYTNGNTSVSKFVKF